MWTPQVKWSHIFCSNLSKGNDSLLPKRLEIQKLLILLWSIFSAVCRTKSICPFASPFLFSEFSLQCLPLLDREALEKRVAGLSERTVTPLFLLHICLVHRYICSPAGVVRRVVGRRQCDVDIVDVASA